MKRLVLPLILGACFLLPGCTAPVDDAPALSLVEENVYQFQDGETLSTWQFPNDDKLIYCLEDGTELLAVSLSHDPGYAVSALDSDAQAQIRSFYAQQGAQYDLEEYLEQAYLEYIQTQPRSDFQCYLIEQSVQPGGCNDHLIYFSTVLMLPITRTESESYVLTQAFEKETGAAIDSWSLFSGSKEEVTAAFLSEGMIAPDLLETAAEQFDPRYIRWDTDGCEVLFPAALADQLGTGGFSAPYTEELLAVLHDWAIPTANQPT